MDWSYEIRIDRMLVTVCDHNHDLDIIAFVIKNVILNHIWRQLNIWADIHGTVFRIRNAVQWKFMNRKGMAI